MGAYQPIDALPVTGLAPVKVVVPSFVAALPEGVEVARIVRLSAFVGTLVVFFLRKFSRHVGHWLLAGQVLVGQWVSWGRLFSVVGHGDIFCG